MIFPSISAFNSKCRDCLNQKFDNIASIQSSFRLRFYMHLECSLVGNPILDLQWKPHSLCNRFNCKSRMTFTTISTFHSECSHNLNQKFDNKSTRSRFWLRFYMHSECTIVGNHSLGLQLKLLHKEHLQKLCCQRNKLTESPPETAPILLLPPKVTQVLYTKDPPTKEALDDSLLNQ